MSKLRCPYCNEPARRTTGAEVYPYRHDLSTKVFYVCWPCDARVGAHADGRPLGRLANAELRRLKMAAHAAFDPLWRSGTLTRKGAYAWLAKAMQLPEAQTHIGMFDEAQCRQVVALVVQRQRREAHAC